MTDILKTVIFIVSGALLFEILFGEVDKSLSEKEQEIAKNTNILSFKRVATIVNSKLS